MIPAFPSAVREVLLAGVRVGAAAGCGTGRVGEAALPRAMARGCLPARSVQPDRHPETTQIYAKLDLEALRALAPAWPGGAS